MEKTLQNYIRTLVLFFCLGTNLFAQCPEEDINFSDDPNVVDCAGTFDFNGQLCPGDQIFFNLEQDILVPPNTQINWYKDTDSNVDPIPANFIGTSEITANPSTVAPCSPCPELLGIMVDACQGQQPNANFGAEPNNEFVVIGSGGGFNTSEIFLDLAIGNNFEPGGTAPGSNADIGVGQPCTITTPSTNIISNVLQSVSCVDVFAAGPNTDIPAGAIFLLFTSCTATPFYDFEELCANGAPIYIGQSTCCRTIGAFTNGSDSGFRTTILEFDCGCNSSITHDTGNPILMSIPPTSGGGIVYFDINDNLVYESTNCVAPPVNVIPLPSVTSNVSPYTYTVSPDDCGNTITIQGVLTPTFDGCNDAMTATFEFTVACETPDLGEAEICVGQTINLDDLLDPNYLDGFWFDNSGQLMEFTATETGDQEINFFSTDCCVLQTSTTITVTEGETVMTVTDTTLCPGQSEIDLDGLILETTIPMGEWSGDGVTGNNFDPAGFQDETVSVFFTPEECGPMSEVNIIIAAAPELMINATICASNSITINGEVYDINRSTDTQLIPAMTGCDTVVNIQINFLDQPESMLVDSICMDGELMVGDSTFNMDKLNGEVIFSGASVEGCDSIVFVNLNIIAPVPPTNIIRSICPGETFEVAGTIYDQDLLSGTEIIKAVNGCDSTINVMLTLREDATNEINVSLCANQDTTINMITYSETNLGGRDTIANGALNGCDSILVVNIEILPAVIGPTINMEICRGDNTEFVFDNETFNEDNLTGMGILPAANGCDSIIPVELILVENISGPDFFRSLCEDSNFSVTFGADTFDSSNPTGTARIQASNGCDSVFLVNLIFNGDIIGEDFETSECSGSGFEVTFGSQTFSEMNPTGMATLQTAEGCDSTFNVVLTFQDEVQGPDFTNTDCAGSGFAVTFGSSTFDETNPMGMATIPSAAGCDSTFNVVLTFQDEVQGPDFTNTDCAGSGFAVTFGSSTFDETNPMGLATIPSAAGCDSTFNVVLTFQDEVQGPDFTNTDCAGNGFAVTFGSTTFDETNPMGLATLPSAAGCDSTFNVVLTFGQETESVIEDNFCSGQNAQVTVGTQVFDETNPMGSVRLDNQNAQGCDSIVIVNLNFENINFELLGNEAICSGDTAVLNIVTNSTDIFDLTLNDSNGNETTFEDIQNGSMIEVSPQSTMTFFVSNITGIACELDLADLFLEIEVSNIEVDIMAGDVDGQPLSCTSANDATLEAIVIGAIGEVNYLWDQGAQTSTLENLGVGTYSVIVTDELGCTDTETIELQSQDSVSIDFIAEASLCDANVGTITIFDITLSNENGFSLFLDDILAPISNLEFPVSFTTNGGMHELVVIDDGGCRWVEEFEIVNVDPNELIIEQQDPFVIESGGSIALDINANFVIDSISWSASDALSCTNCLNPIASPLNTTLFRAEVFDIQGCNIFTNVTVIVDKVQNVYIPNIFSPNEDGFNDQFYVFGNVEVAQVREFHIYDKWGNQVFTAENIPANDPASGWDGKYRGERMQPGVFVYYGIIEFIDGSELFIEGDVTLIK